MKEPPSKYIYLLLFFFHIYKINIVRKQMDKKIPAVQRADDVPSTGEHLLKE